MDFQSFYSSVIDENSSSDLSFDEIMKRFDEKLEHDLQLYKMTWTGSFESRKAEEEWGQSSCKKRCLSFYIAVCTNLVYFLTACICASISPKFKHHSGGLIILFPLFTISLFNFLVLIMSHCVRNLKESIKLLIQTRNPYFFVATFYPSIALRCLGYLKIFMAHFHFGETNPSFQLETLSFWLYIYLVHVMLFWFAEMRPVLVFPFLVMSSICSLFSEFLPSNEHGMHQGLLLLISSLLFSGLLALGLREITSSQSWKMLYYRSVQRERQCVQALRCAQLKCLEKAVEEKSAVFGELAHDIGSPLAALSMAVDLLDKRRQQWLQDTVCMMTYNDNASLVEHQNEADQQAEECFDAIHAAISMIQVLRQSMLDYVKKVHGATIKPSLEPVDLNYLVSKKIFVVLKQLLAERGSRVEPIWKIDQRLIRTKVMSSVNWLSDMLMNYVSNAVKFTDVGFVKISVRLVDTGEEHILFEVKDSGKGVAEEAEEKLFSKFGQGQHDKGGTGLGLVSVKQKALLLEGDAGFRNNLDGHGSTFYFWIPFIPNVETGVEDTFDDYKSVSERGIPQSSKQTRKKPALTIHCKDIAVMVVDDSQLLLNLYTRLLEKCKVSTVQAAISGEEALEMFFESKEHSFDLIFMDDQMEGQRGPVIARLISERCAAKQMKCPDIYICTGSSADAIEREFPQIYLFVCAILQKPVSLGTIKGILDGKDVSDGVFSKNSPAPSSSSKNSVFFPKQARNGKTSKSLFNLDAAKLAQLKEEQHSILNSSLMSGGGSSSACTPHSRLNMSNGMNSCRSKISPVKSTMSSARRSSVSFRSMDLSSWKWQDVEDNSFKKKDASPYAHIGEQETKNGDLLPGATLKRSQKTKKIKAETLKDSLSSSPFKRNKTRQIHVETLYHDQRSYNNRRFSLSLQKKSNSSQKKTKTRGSLPELIRPKEDGLNGSHEGSFIGSFRGSLVYSSKRCSLENFKETNLENGL